MRAAAKTIVRHAVTLAMLITFTSVALLCGVSAHANTTSATRSNDNVLQGNFETGAPDVFLTTHPNARRVGTGGASGAQRVNQPVLGFTLPTLGAGEPITNVTFSFTMDDPAIQGAPIGFDMVISLMNQTNIAGFSPADFIEGTAPVNTSLGNGIVIGQLSTADVAIYSSALTQQEVLEHYAAGLPADAPPEFTVQPQDQLSDISAQVTFSSAVRSLGGFEGSVATKFPPGLTVRTGSSTLTLTTNLVANTWYNMWQVQDNATDTMQVYLTTGNQHATPDDRFEVNGVFAFPFRNGTSSPLTFYQLIARSLAAGHWMDDIYISTGINLVNPVALPTLDPISISLQGGSPVVTWTGAGTLQRTEDLEGTSTDLPAATSPYTSGGAANEYFRLRE